MRCLKCGKNKLIFMHVLPFHIYSSHRIFLEVVAKQWRKGTSYNIKQLLTGFYDNISSAWPKDGSCARNYRLNFIQDCCCIRTQSLTVLLHTFIFQLFFYSWSVFPLTYPLDIFNILVRQDWESGPRLDIVTSISCGLLNRVK